MHAPPGVDVEVRVSFSEYRRLADWAQRQNISVGDLLVAMLRNFPGLPHDAVAGRAPLSVANPGLVGQASRAHASRKTIISSRLTSKNSGGAHCRADRSSLFRIMTGFVNPSFELIGQVYLIHITKKICNCFFIILEHIGKEIGR